MFNKIVNLVESNGFLKGTLFTKLNLKQYKVGPVGALLLENLKLEWFYETVLNKNSTVIINQDDFTETFDYAKNLCSAKLPFGIAEIIKTRKFSNDEQLIKYYSARMESEQIDFDNLFDKEDNLVLKCTMFVDPKDSMSFFHQWQRQRRIWWRKFSAVPGRYSLTDIKINENVQNVEILAKYPWNSQVVEKLTHDSNSKLLSAERFQFQDLKKPTQPHVIVSEICLLTALLNTICDAYDTTSFQGKPRENLRFHRKLAPYKISFSITATSATAIAELNDLAMYLSKQLKTSHVSCLFVPSSSKLTLEAQYKQYDQLGIPYNVILNENTLKNGIVQLRSRDTTLKEQVHVTDLVPYVEKCFKNY